MPSFLHLFQIAARIESRAAQQMCLHAAVDFLYRDIQKGVVNKYRIECDPDSITVRNTTPVGDIAWVMKDGGLYRIESNTMCSLVCRNIVQGSFFRKSEQVLTILLITKTARIERKIYV